MGGPRSLVLANVQAWPAVDGYRKRLAQMVEALTAIGEVDVFFTEPALPELDGPPPVAARLVRVTPRPQDALTRARRWVLGSRPRFLDAWDMGDAVTRFRREAGTYDLVLYSHVSAWVHFAGIVDAPALVDVNNLDSLELRLRSGVGGPTAGPARPDLVTPDGWKRLARRTVDRVDAARMERIEHDCAAAVEAVALCSQLDLDRAGFPNGHVIPNGSSRPSDPPDRSDRGVATELFFVGQLRYPPNQDAVRWFAAEVLPLVRAELPDTRFRVVGHSPEAVADVGRLDGVDLIGPIEDLQVELDRASVEVVPIRFGSGTRLKVLEALANRLAVVTTSIGCEGIDVADGESALVADDPVAFAAACVRALRDPDLRAQLGVAGEALWDAQYRWSAIRHRFAELARDVAEGR